MTADQQQPYSVQQQPPPSASEDRCEDCDRGHCHGHMCDGAAGCVCPAPSTGATAGGEHNIVDKWRDAVVQCSCGWQGAEKTMKAVLASWRQHKGAVHV